MKSTVITLLVVNGLFFIFITFVNIFDLGSLKPILGVSTTVAAVTIGLLINVLRSLNRQ